MEYRLPEILKKLRKAKKMTQETLGNKIGISWKMISYWENGKKIPSLDNVIFIADLFGVTLDYLVHGKKEQESSIWKTNS